MSIPKVIRNGKVAVLVSYGFGAGWSTWALGESSEERMMFDPDLVAAIESKASSEEIEKIAQRNHPEEYLGGLDGLSVEWLPVGTQFIIEEYDGAEQIRTNEETKWVTA
jgi:hypothetical protein